MIRKSLARGLLFCGSILIANLSSALSLGELSLQSALNEPLRATIPFKDAADLSESQIIARLASVEDFENSGVEYAYFLSDLAFTVQVDGNGAGLIHISTKDPIVEPYLDFLLEARWPSGRMLREFTVLLDLPIIAEGSTSAVEAAEGGVISQASVAAETPEMTETTTVVEEPAPVEAGIQPRAGDQRMVMPAAEAETEYRVQHDDTLWEIAARFRPSKEVSVQQTMLALLRNNPEAFINGNVNQLKSGYVLRLPTADEAAEVAAQDAIGEVRKQNDIWMGKSSAETPAAPQLMATETGEEVEPTSAPVPDARLSIATPGEDEVSEGTAESGAEGAGLRDALAASEENLEKAKRENDELNSRLEDLESQLSTLQRLLQLKDDQLAALQASKAAEKTEPAAAEMEPAAEEAMPPEEDKTAPEEAAPVEAGEAAPAMAAPVEQQPEASAEPQPAPQPVLQPTPESQAEPESESFADMLGADRQLLMNIAMAVVILLVLVLLMRFLKQRREAREEEERVIASHLEEIKAEDSTFGAESAMAGEDAREFTAEEEQPSELEKLLAEGEAESALSTDELMGRGAAADEVENEPVEAETGDAIAEAEIYVAYGRYDQAAELLKNAIAKEPRRSDLRTKLLGVYLETRDKDSFLTEFEALQAMGDDAALSQVRDSMSAMEGVSDWLRGFEPSGTTAPAAAAPAEEPEDSFENFADLDLGDDEEDEPEEVEFDLDLESEGLDLSGGLDFELDTEEDEEPEAEETGGLDIDLDLGEAFTSELTAEPESPKVEPKEAGGLDIDLDLGGDFSDELITEPEPPKVESKEAGGLDIDLDLGEELGADLTTEPESPKVEFEEPEESDELGDLSFDVDLDALDEELGLEDAFTEGLETEQPAEQAPVVAPVVEEAPVVEAPKEVTPQEPTAPAAAFEGFQSGTAGEEMDDFGLLGDSDEVSTKLDLARAYIDMGDNEGAREMLQEVLQEGDDTQKQEANSLLERL